MAKAVALMLGALAPAAAIHGMGALMTGKCKSLEHCASIVEAAAPPRYARMARSVFEFLGAAHDWEHHEELARFRATNQWCKNNSYWELLPAPVANLSYVPAPDSVSQAWVNQGCFNNMVASATFGPDGATVTFTGSNATSLLCSDLFLVATQFGLTPLELAPLSPTASVKVNFTADGEAADVQLNGLGVYIMPCGLLGTVESLLATVSLFDGPSQQAMTDANLQFLTQRGVWKAPVAPFGLNVTVDKTKIKSGSYLAIGRFDGLDPMIMWAVGGVTGHSAIAVHDPSDGQLYVAESTDVNPFGKAYWPPPYGIIRTPWDQWVSQAQQAGYHVALLPIKVDLAFDETAFWNWFKTVQGMPYGYHSMLYTFMDVGPANGNLPLPIVAQSVTAVLNLAESSGLLANSSAGVSAYSMITWGANMRLNTSCTTLACVIRYANAQKAAGKRPSNLLDVMAIPDNDGFNFGGNYSMVCSEFAAQGWKRGLSAGLPVFSTIIANEQSPKDNYQMALYEPNYFDNTSCPGGLVNSPDGNGWWCQIMGQYKMVLNGYNTVPLYAGMNNFCPSQWPEYVRCPAGNPTCC